MFCTNCGKKLEFNEKFCPYCGEKMQKPETQPAPAPEQQTKAPSPQPAPAPEQQTKAPSPQPYAAVSTTENNLPVPANGKSPVGVVLLVIGLILVVLAVLGVFNYSVAYFWTGAGAILAIVGIVFMSKGKKK